MAIVVIAVFGVMFVYATAHGEIFGALLDGSEQLAMSETLQYTLENSSTNQAAAWANPDTGNSGTLVPVRTFYNDDREPCREFVATIIIDGVEQQGQGMACRQPDGQWLIVPEDAVEYRPIIRDDDSLYSYYPYGYVDWYSRYPYYLWDAYYPSIFFSFNVVHFSRHHHSHRNRIILNSGSFRDKRIIHHRRNFNEQRIFRRTIGVRNGRAFQNHRQVRSQERFTGQRRIEANRQRQWMPQLRVNSPLREQRTHFDGRNLSGSGRFEELRRFGGGSRGGQGRR
jgi:surface antigen